jgi:A/G-specific adenine glycosylase
MVLAATMPTPEYQTFRHRLTRWYRRTGRDLPWRNTRDPYEVLVSEFMLQQTQVSRVELYYGKFLRRYPTIHALAALIRPRCGRAGKDWVTTGVP